MPSGSSKSSKPKPAEVAAEAKKYYIPLIKKQYGDQYKSYSYLYVNPLDLDLSSHARTDKPPQFGVYPGDPVEFAIAWAKQPEVNERIPLICAANDKRAGGDWETGVVGYEERLCRRSNLSATLATPGPESSCQSNYPIPIEGGIMSETVVVFRGPHDRYDKLELWDDLPVCSVPPVARPKLTQQGTKYSFAEERDMVKNKLRVALRICLYNGYTKVVIGDFGLGNGCRNPPREMAELWREVFLWDPEIRGRITYVSFVFEDMSQSTARLIMEDLSKKSKHGGHSSHGSSKSKSKSSSTHHSHHSHSVASSSSSASSAPLDSQIFEAVFNSGEIERVLHERDPRYGFGTLMAPL